ncbi:hypothetical protein EDEG_02939 [Edhazardia aedis USNM 41457]|uniref:Cation/H+ exchanger transmembrane domain-containing protein n=1 Tax=Edhazardia aedis (strain USNM 41457) TaxID=1003232 RepID=J8ZSN5_EDHAE|nr:hypothetical protein EDEG_02939 [Edhazardia aedis USNM 41457]|eukprot:EJW02668.1 hypothetical protein EDEG_02939 [Edhazardia aedis USNM 41457]
MLDNFFITTALISGFVYFYGLISLLMKENLGLSEPLIGTIYGIAIAIFNRYETFSFFKNVERNKNSMVEADSIMKELSRIVVSLQVVAVGLVLPKSYITKEWKSLFVILVPLMLATYFISSIFALYIFKFDIKLALLIGACVTPTDPVLAATIMKGKFAARYIPKHLRNLLTAESGANDGLGSLLLAFSIFIGEKDWKKMAIKTILIDVILSITIGATVGYICRKMQLFCKQKNWIDKESFLVSMISLGIFVTAITTLCHSADILASFVCGIAFSWDHRFLKDIKKSHLLEVIDMLINHVFFILFGFFVSFSSFKVSYIWYILVVIFIRRLPLFLGCYKVVPQLRNLREALFAGYFGPVGVGAILFAYHGYDQIKDKNLRGIDEFLPIVQFVVLGSIILHGATSLIITKLMSIKKEKNQDAKKFAISSDFHTSDSKNENLNDNIENATILDIRKKYLAKKILQSNKNNDTF